MSPAKCDHSRGYCPRPPDEQICPDAVRGRCVTCGEPNTHGGRICDTCYEVERRLETYLKAPGGRWRVLQIMRRLFPNT